MEVIYDCTSSVKSQGQGLDPSRIRIWPSRPGPWHGLKICPRHTSGTPPGRGQHWDSELQNLLKHHQLLT